MFGVFRHARDGLVDEAARCREWEMADFDKSFDPCDRDVSRALGLPVPVVLKAAIF